MMKKVFACVLVWCWMPTAAVADAAVMELARSAGCLTCHSMDTKMAGPSFQDIAARRKGEAGAEDILVEAVKKGSSGIYGPIPMPPSPAVSLEDTRRMVQYILSL